MVFYGQPVLSLYINLIFLYHVNQCRVQLGTQVVVVAVAGSIHYYSTETDITHMDDSLFSIFPPIFEKVVKWGSGFISVLFACSYNFFMNAIRSGAIQGMLLSNIR